MFPDKQSLLSYRTTKICFLFFFTIFLNTIYLSGIINQETDANVFGHVVNAEDGEHIPFINVFIEGTRIGTITDASGHYILTNLTPGKHTLVVKGMGYESKSVEFEISSNQTLEMNIEISYTGVDLDEVIITASPTASGFRYQPDMAYMSEDLQRMAEVSFGEMLNGEPGVAMRSMGSAPARPVIRGMDGDRILVLENGERMGDISETSADHTISLDPLVANRLEIVRGPASLLYGSSALGGVINLMTTDIPDSWDIGSSGVISLQGATMNSMGAGFGRYTYGNDNWAASGRFSHRRTSDITTPEGILKGTSMSNIDGSLGIGYNNGRSTGGISYSLSDMAYEIPENINDPDEGVKIKVQRHALQGRVNFRNSGFFDRGQLRFNATHMFQQEIEYELENGIINEDVELEYNKYALSTTYTMQHKPFEFFDRGAVGFNLHGHRLDVRGSEAYTPGELRMNLGVFTFQEIPLSATIRLQAGLRFDAQHTGAMANESFPEIVSNRNGFTYTGSFGFNHRPVEELEIGGQFARSHRNPSVEELFADGAHLGLGVYEIGNPNIKAETGQGIDLFIRWTNGIIDFEVAGFVNYFRNYIIFEPTGEVDPVSGYPVFQYQGDEARLTGGELSALMSLTDNLKITISADYVDSRRLNNGRFYLPFIPPFRLMGNIEYNMGRAWIGGNMHSADSQRRVAPGEGATNGYTLFGLSAGYRINSAARHVIVFRVDNILDERYRDHLSRIRDRNVLMPGRNFILAYRLFF